MTSDQNIDVGTYYAKPNYRFLTILYLMLTYVTGVFTVPVCIQLMHAAVNVSKIKINLLTCIVTNFSLSPIAFYTRMLKNNNCKQQQ